MAYTIVKSNGTVLTTVPDGTINTTSTSIGLPGRNYAGYGQALDTNFVHQLENFADTTPPANPLAGQLWFDTNSSTMKVCPVDGETNAAAWLTLTSTASGGTTTFGAVTVTGNVQANNLSAVNLVTANAASLNYLTVSANANIADANISTANIGTLRTTVITAGAPTSAGTITGGWTANGDVSGNAIVYNQGNIYINNTGNVYGIKTDKYMYANGSPISFAGTYSNTNVASYLTVYGGNVLSLQTQATTLTTGANTTSGTITGNWTLSAGSKLNATYADLAERFAADDIYPPGTVVELGGAKEITAVQYELSEDVFGVISNSAGYIMNAGAGNDNTHPAVAVSGRVQVKIMGAVIKGQRLVSAGNGFARAAKPGEANAFNTIGRSLENKTTTDFGTVEAIVILR
jgi:hypothetical protein